GRRSFHRASAPTTTATATAVAMKARCAVLARVRASTQERFPVSERIFLLLQLFRQERVHDEVDAPSQPGVVADRAQHALALEADLLRDALGGNVLLVGAKLQACEAAVHERPGGNEPE